jgi:hypothetical protein
MAMTIEINETVARKVLHESAGLPVAFADGGRMISSGYDHDPNHYGFQRTLSGDLEPLQPESGWGVELLRLAGVAACIALLWAFAWVLSGLFS